MCEDVDLYDDLPVLSFGESISKIEEERQYFKEQATEKEKELQKIKEQIATLEKSKKTLEENISSLYKTAVNEIKRKDQIIEDLRREKDSIVFRRKGRQNHSVNATSYTQKNEIGIESSIHEDSVSPANHTSIHGDNSTEESHKIVSAVISCSDNKSKDSEENHYKTSEKTPVLYEKKTDHLHKRQSEFKDTVLNPVVSENCSSKIVDTSFDDFTCSSHPEHIPGLSKSPEQSSRQKSSKDVRESRSLSSESRRESKPKGSDNYSSLRPRYISPHSRNRSSRVYNEKHRDDKIWHHSDDRYSHRNKYKESSRRDEKFKVRNSYEFNDKYNVHSKRSPSPQVHRRHASNPNERYTYSRYVSTKMGRSTKMQTDNVRLATQLKFKYSKAMRERSVSCSPVKRKRFSLRSSSPISESSNQSSSVLNNSALKSDVEENIAAKRNNSENLKSKKLLTKTSQKHHISSSSPSDCVKCMNRGCDMCKKCKIEDVSANTRTVDRTEVSNCAERVVSSFPKQSNENKQLRNVPGSAVTLVDSVQNRTKTTIEKCDAAVGAETELSDLKQKNISFLKESASDVKKNTQIELISDTCDSLENANVNKNGFDRIDDNVCHSQKINNNSLSSVESMSNEKSVLEMNADTVELSNKERISREELPIRLSTTPPSKNLIPLKISPSFENPAVVEDSKFSHSVFNEQCEFKRHKRKKFKKLLVTDFKNEKVSDAKHTQTCDGQYFENVSSGQQKFNCSQQVNFDNVKDCNIVNKVNSLSTENISVQGDIVCNNNNNNNNNNFSNGTLVNETSTVGICSKGNANQQETVILLDGELESNVLHKSTNLLRESPNGKVLQHKSPNRKRKLDSICEELKANLEKKSIAENAALIPTCNSNILPISQESKAASVNPNNEDQKTTTVVSDTKNLEREVSSTRETAVHSDETPKHVVVSKRRRRIPNLQDNVVKVLSHIKSTTP